MFAFQSHYSKTIWLQFYDTLTAVWSRCKIK